MIRVLWLVCGIPACVLILGGCGGDEREYVSDEDAAIAETYAADPAPPQEGPAEAEAHDAAIGASALPGEGGDDDQSVASSASGEPERVHPAALPLQDCVTQSLEMVRRAFEALDVAEVVIHEVTSIEGNEMRPIRHLARFGSREEAFITDEYADLVIREGVLWYQWKANPADYARVPYVGDLMDAIGSFRSVSNLAVALYAGRDLDFFLPMLRLGAPHSQRPESCREVTLADGRQVVRVHLTGADTDTWVDVDVKSGELVAIRAAFRVLDEPFLYERNLRFEVTELDALPEPIAFDPEGLQEWPTIELATRRILRESAAPPPALEPLTVGDPAPPFELRSLFGTRHQFVPVGDHYTVIGFWTMPHSTSAFFLAELEGLDGWFRRTEQNVNVIAINTRGGPGAASVRFDQAFDLWETRERRVIGLFEEQNTVAQAYRASPVPAIVVVAPDGSILAAWNGMPRGFLARVRDLIAAHRAGEADASQ